jgi:hypothetical protein
MSNENTDLARQLVTNFIERRTPEVLQFGKLVAEDHSVKESVKNGLIEIAKGEESFEDIHTRRTALVVLVVLGMTKTQDVHNELCDLFTMAFDEQELQELAAFQALPKTQDEVFARSADGRVRYKRRAQSNYWTASRGNFCWHEIWQKNRRANGISVKLRA